MMRLQQCLKGKAREAVQSMLFLPDRVEDIIDLLTRSFGRPDHIVKAMIFRAKQMSVIREDRLDALEDFSNIVRNLVATIESMDRMGHLYNPQLLEELLVKLPCSLRLRWGHVVRTFSEEVSTIRDFSNWLKTEADAISHIGGRSFADRNDAKPLNSKWTTPKQDVKSSQRQIKNVLATVNKRSSKMSCKFCKKGGHDITQCYAFKRTAVLDRRKWALANKTCFCCFETGHYGSQCPQKCKCTYPDCYEIHHILLHIDTDRLESETVAHSSTGPGTVLLRVAPVSLICPKGKVSTYALFDEASTVTLLDSNLANKLGLEGTRDPLSLRWTDASTQSEMQSQRVSLSIRGGSNDVFQLSNVRTVSTFLTQSTPTMEQILKELKEN